MECWNGERRGGAAGIRAEVGDEKGRKKKRPEQGFIVGLSQVARNLKEQMNKTRFFFNSHVRQ